jgi:hypothetical protein
MKPPPTPMNIPFGSGGRHRMPTRKKHSKPRKSSREENYKQLHLSSWITHAKNHTRNKDSENMSTSSDDLPKTTQSEGDAVSKQVKTISTKTNFTQIKLAIDTTNNLPFGDLIEDSSDGERIVFHNINGMKDQKNWYQIINSMREYNVNIFGFTELNQSLTRGYNNAWISTIRKIFYYSRSIFSESNVQLETNYKPGGTMTTITGKWQARVTEMGNDARGLGRWSYVKLQSKKNTLMIVTAYRPTVSQGPSTVWMQQWALLRESGERNPDPIATFYLDLEKMLREWKSHGYEIILMMDANETIGDAPSKLTGTLNRLEMTDLVRHKHPNLPEPNTHIRGSSRIDFILGTPKVIANCTKAGIVPFGYGYHSDHRATSTKSCLQR